AVKLRNHLQFVERAAKKDRLGHHAANRDGRRRHQPDFLARAREVILGISDTVVAEVADAGLAAFAEGKKVRADLFDFAPAGGEGRDADDNASNVRVGRGGIKRVGVVVKDRLGVAIERAEKVGGALFLDFTAYVEDQHAFRRELE